MTRRSIPFLLLALPLLAQDESPVYRSDTRLVVLHATVVDQQGRLITNLPQSAFRVFENGTEQQIKVFRREDAAVSIGLVIDDSGSMIPKRQRVAAAGLGFIRASHPENELFVLHFNEKTYLDTPFTNNVKELERGLSTFDSRGTTSMRDAVRLALAHLEYRGKEDKKVLLVVTDGEDNSSETTREFLLKEAQRTGIIIYPIGLLEEIDDEKTQRARKDLDALAAATGGQSYYLKSVEQIDRTVREIARDIRNQYTIAYSPTNEALDGTYRKLELQVTAPDPVVIRTRAGYWAGGAPAITQTSRR